MASTKEQILGADKLIFPGVGAFGSAMARLGELGFVEPIREYIRSGKPFFGVCLGMQTLFEASEESPGVEGLGVIPGKIVRFDVPGFAVPHMGWNGVNAWKETATALIDPAAKYYFVHSYMAHAPDTPKDWVLTTTDYGGQTVVSSVQKGNVFACQFHPEKSGKNGLAILRRFLEIDAIPDGAPQYGAPGVPAQPATALAKRVIACLDVRSNDNGDIVVTKGDQYDVREKDDGREVRNLGKPVELAERYYLDGADEITFLNITSFRNCPLADQPMLDVLRQASEKVFVPLCVGGGIRSCTDPDGRFRSAVEVAGEYFRSGADKVSLGTDAVTAAMEHIAAQKAAGRAVGDTLSVTEHASADGLCSISAIAQRYGAQAVVISVDPKRVYGKSDAHATFAANEVGPNGETECWYQCTVKGGRETVDLSAAELAVACEALGAGEILLNCIDHDGSNKGFEHALVRDVKAQVGIPVIASSGAGKPAHFPAVFAAANPDAALAAGIFHRKEVAIAECKEAMQAAGVPVRM
eukprot:TRINITY_DN27524_c0_g1_i1.p1 TRINITY_DN27524_c0_g1~~TRINITY_DN27524_c0_g1_i1.p1  ORF type:complete len:590 (+),score=247.60 TRINITY_DN27524_c0_g1_i1:196-1770(+)